MSETRDKESQTEEATDKRLTDARLEGNVPVTREAANFGFLITGLLATIAVSTISGGKLAELLVGLFGNVGSYRLESGGDLALLVSDIALKLTIIVAPVLLMFTLAGVAAALVQNPPAMVWKRVMPQASRISPMKGFQRLTGITGLFEFLKTTLRFWLMTIVGAWVIYGDWTMFRDAIQLSGDGILHVWLKSTFNVLIALAVVSACLLALDWPLAHIMWRRGLRMSHDEIKQERKQMEGDALIKNRRRAIARARLKRRMTRDVSRATLVIANPTHFAVALRYVRQEGGAPRVVAKGQDNIALAIRRVAEEKGIPVVEDKVLARSLYSKVEVDQMIPVEFYRAIAEILIRLQSRQRQVAAGRA